MKHFYGIRRWTRAYSGATTLVFMVMASAAWSQPASTATDNLTYTHSAKAGDTLIHLAKRYLIKPQNWQSLQKLNKITDPHRIRPGTPIRIPLSDMKTTPAIANVVSLEGPVESTAGKLQVGSAISEGQGIKTGENGFVTLKLADGSTLVVQSKSQLRLEVARTIANTGGVPVTRTALESGRVEAKIAKVQKRGDAAGRFEIVTPTSNMGVRGTEFRVASDADGKASRGEVLEGIVNVTGAAATKNLNLTAGFGTVVEKGKQPIQPVKLSAAPDLQATAKLQERVLLRFKFAELSGASSYRAQVASDSAFTDLRAEGVFKIAEAKFADLADGAYFLRVRAIDNNGIEGSDAVTPFRLKARPEPPFTSAPANKSKFSGDSAMFNWASASEAASYRFQLAHDTTFATLVADEKSHGGVSYTPAAKLTPGEYYWRAASVRKDGDNGPFGDVQSFMLKPVPAVPNPPKDEGDRIGFSWGAEPMQRFEFQLARDAAFKDLVMEKNLDKPEISIDKPGEAGTYFMRYRATDPDGFVAPFSSAQSFEVKGNYWWLMLLLVPLLF